jgi:hypothetical protein
MFVIPSNTVTRDHAIQIAVLALGRWHAEDHGERCVCLEGEKFGFQAAAAVDALIAHGVPFANHEGSRSAGLRPARWGLAAIWPKEDGTKDDGPDHQDDCCHDEEAGEKASPKLFVFLESSAYPADPRLGVVVHGHLEFTPARSP